MRSFRPPAFLSLAFSGVVLLSLLQRGELESAGEIGLLLLALLAVPPVVVLLSVRGVRRRWLDLGGRAGLAERVALGWLPAGPLALLAHLADVRAAGFALFLLFLLWRRLDAFGWTRALRTGQVEAVIEALRRSRQRGQPPSTRVLEASHLALFLAGAGVPGAIAAVLEVIRDDPAMPPGLVGWMEALHRWGIRDGAGAEVLAGQALAEDPSPTLRLWCLQLRARALHAQGKGEEALAVLGSAGELRVAQEDRTDLRLQVVQLLMDLDRTEEARQEALSALDLAREPRHVGLTALAAAEIHLFTGDSIQADHLAKMAAGTVPGVDLRAQVRNIRARCLILAGAPDRARYLLERALRDPLAPPRAMESAGLLLMVALALRDGRLVNSALYVVSQAAGQAGEVLASQGALLRLAASGQEAPPDRPALDPGSWSLPWLEALALAAHRTGDEHLGSVARALSSDRRFSPYLARLFPALLEGIG